MQGRFLLFKVIFFLFSNSFILFFLGCSGVPSEWADSARIVSVSGDLNTVSLEGYPPFTLEYYNNPLFEGNSVLSESVSDLNFVNPVSPAPFQNGTPYYLRVKSAFGRDWTVYGGAKDPFPLIKTSGAIGSSDNPLKIQTREDLIALSKESSQWGSSVVLTQDIDLTGVEWKPIGDSSTLFTGTFNGAGHIISGLNSIAPSDTFCAGLFGYIEGTRPTMNEPVVENLGIKLGDITCSNVQYLGGLAGRCIGTGTITNCYVEGIAIRGGYKDPSAYSRMGGLVGTTFINITNCYTNILIDGTSLVLGGFMGASTTDYNISEIRYCYSAGDVTCSFNNSMTGGFAGAIWEHTTGVSRYVFDCVALNRRVERAPQNPSKLFVFSGVTETLGDYLVDNCYYNGKMICSGSVSMIGLVTYTPGKINPCTMNQNTPPFDQWDFVNTWKWDEATNRPVLRKVRR